jgi:HKD family nuclease
LPTSKDITIASGFIPPSGISPPNRQNAAPLDPVSTKSGEGHPLSSQREIASTFNVLLDGCDHVSFAVAWASCGFDTCDRLLKSHRKIRHGVVGTHFYQTDPEFIESLIGKKNVKFVLNPSGVFHPKVYLFEGRGESWSCLIGSANFTAGGFGENCELLLHIEMRDDSTGAIGSELRSQIEMYWDWQTAIYADKIPLERYRYWHDHFKRPLDKSQGRFDKKRAKKNLDEIALLNMGWPEFFSKVEGDPYHGLEGRIEVLSAARTLFEKHGSLAAMPIEDRQGVGGFFYTSDTPWGWFGGMGGAGIFKNLINEHPQGLSNALDEIPLEGPVQRGDYKAFIDQYIAAYPQINGKPTRHGLATATRLLAMKRPDYFVCLDKANRAGLSEAFGITINNHDYDAYWDSIIERICEAKWWNCGRPRRNIEAQVWDGRAAFLDAIYYEEITD